MRRIAAHVAVVPLLTAVLVLVPAFASAGDFLVEPFFAWWRSAPVGTGTDTAAWHPGGGVAAHWMSGALIAGGELGYASGFFDPSQGASDLIQTSQLLTASATVGITRQYKDAPALLPYGTIGFGLVRQQAKDRAGLIDVTRNDPGMSFGGGARYFFTRYVGLAGDARYFVDLRQPFPQTSDLTADIGRLTFWRVSAAVVLRFGD